MRRRRRPILRWVCTATLLLAVALLLFDLRWGSAVGYTRAGASTSRYDRLYRLHLDAGCVGAGYYDLSKGRNQNQQGWSLIMFPRSEPFKWWFFSQRIVLGSAKLAGFVSVPLWMFACALGVPAALLWRSYFRERARPGHCAWCSYDRSGLAPSAPCPECGQTSVG